MCDSLDSARATLARIAALLQKWAVPVDRAFVVDAPALYLHGVLPSISSNWRSHQNFYVDERYLPWTTNELDETVPPLGSTELKELLAMHATDISVHLVPASRYFDRPGLAFSTFWYAEVPFIAVTPLACLALWGWRGDELISRREEIGADLEALVDLRLCRLEELRSVGTFDDQCLAAIDSLRDGYRALREGDLTAARQLFQAVSVVPSSSD